MSIYASNYKGDKCSICNGPAKAYSTDAFLEFYECETCGRFEFGNHSFRGNKDKLASYLYYNGKIDQPIKNNSSFFNYIGNKEYYETKYKQQIPYCYYVSNEIIENWYPASFSDKVDTFLLGIWKLQKYLGYEIHLMDSELLSATFVIRRDETGQFRAVSECMSQAVYLIKYLVSQDYIESTGGNGIILKSAALKRIDELQKNITKESKTVFIAMSFKPEMNEVREAIKTAVENAGFTPRIMDEIEHNHQIIPEMLYEIKQAKFVIAELSDHNNGAYFEAGYALGLGKEVIQVCRKAAFDAGCCHFDVKQVNTILWENIEQLKDKLYNRIKATM